MQNERKAISPLLYYILISSLTSLVFILAGVVALDLFSFKQTNLTIIIITILLLWKGGFVVFVSWFSHKKSQNKEFTVKFIGRNLGSFYGILIGGFWGASFANMFRQDDIIGFFIGALAFYLVGRWIGSKVSVSIGGQLDKVFSITETQEPEKVVKATPLIRLFLIFFIVVSPLLLVVIALLINYFDIPVGYIVEWLPITRIIVIALSIYSICYPWLMRKRWLLKFQSDTSSLESVTPWLGLAFTIVPAVYGFVLFIGLGASIIELCFFAMASSIAAIIWIAYNPVPEEQKAATEPQKS